MCKLPAIPLLLVLACPALAQTTPDPWAGVPALPTTCYRQGDTFDDQAYAAIEGLNAREARQRELNQAVEQQTGEVDIMVVQQRMITLMSENPEKAQQYMEALQRGAQQVQEESPELAEQSGQLLAGLQELVAAYDAELQEALEPVKKKQADLNATLAKSCNMDLVARAAALKAEQNQAYAGVCGKWWQAGPFHDWLARFRQFKIDEARQWMEFAETARLNYEMQGADVTDYRSTADLKAPGEYLRKASEIFGKREYAPSDETPGDCEIRHG